MLTGLSVRNLALVDRLDLDFGPGLNVLTGETGAGKSILLDCLGLALGWRSRADALGPGGPQGEVSADFSLPPGHRILPLLGEAGVPAGDELVLRRVIHADGRKTAFANDRRITAETLRALAATLIEMHGQQDDGGLADPKGHRHLLDDFAGNAAALARVQAAWTDWKQAERALQAARDDLEVSARDADWLRHAAAELARLNPQPDEEAALDTSRRLMQAAARIRGDMEKAAALLSGEGAIGQIWQAQRLLEAVQTRAEGLLEQPLAALERAAAETSEAQAGLDRALDALHFDEGALEQTEERLFAIRALARKHNLPPEDLPALKVDFTERLARLETGSGAIPALERQVQAAERAYADAARQLSQTRVVAARALDRAMQAELPPLKLDKARFLTALEPSEPGPEGTDRIAFLVATSPTAEPGPISRIASGGELSRFLLALKVCLSANAPGVSLIFDEIDRGVGGATADAVGRRLAQLATGAQILVVTHSPQVAAFGSRHLLVSKDVASGLPSIRVAALDAPARTDEIARMLSGSSVTEAARMAARALLQPGAG